MRVMLMNEYIFIFWHGKIQFLQSFQDEAMLRNRTKKDTKDNEYKFHHSTDVSHEI